MNKNGNNKWIPLILVAAAVAIAAFVAVISFSAKGRLDSEEDTIADVTVNQEEEIEQMPENVPDEEEGAAVQEPEPESALEEETAEEWVRSLDAETGTVLVWNEETGNRLVLEEGQEYKLQEDDKILIALSGILDAVDCSPIYLFEDFKLFEPIYLEALMNVEERQDVSIKVEVDGQWYENQIVLIGEPKEEEEVAEAEAGISKDEIDIDSQLSGKEWAESLGFEVNEPFLAVINDESNEKIILEIGEHYQLKENDKFYIYIPEFAYVESVKPLGISLSAEPLDNGSIFEVDKSYIDKNAETTMKITVIDLRKSSENAISLSYVLSVE